MFIYGSIVRIKTAKDFAKAGDLFKVVIEEGDGEVGLLRHSLCHRLNAEGKPETEYVYEIAWEDMVDVTETYLQDSISGKAAPIKQKIQECQAQLDALNQIGQSFTRPTEDFLKDFRAALSAD